MITKFPQLWVGKFLTSNLSIKFDLQPTESNPAFEPHPWIRCFSPSNERSLRRSHKMLRAMRKSTQEPSCKTCKPTRYELKKASGNSWFESWPFKLVGVLWNPAFFPWINRMESWGIWAVDPPNFWGPHRRYTIPPGTVFLITKHFRYLK